MARILIADDSDVHIKNVSDILSKHGHELLIANDGLQAFDMANSEMPDAIIMDVVMPILNGFQATRKITQNPDTKHIPIIMLTAKEQEADKVWALRQGASGYISKPPTESELVDVLNSLLNFSEE